MHILDYVLGFHLPEDPAMESNKEQVEWLLQFDFGQKQQMNFFQRIGLTKYVPKTAEETEIERMQTINTVKIEQFLKNRDKLDLFNQTNSYYKFKSGRLEV